jgi:hypothetical protein
VRALVTRRIAENGRNCRDFLPDPEMIRRRPNQQHHCSLCAGLFPQRERLWWSRTVSLNGFAEFRVDARKLIDCRLLGFADGAQAVNYVTSHAVEGFRNERLFNLLNNSVWETERRIRAA